jgi:uncharacterized protein YuzE
MRLTYDRNLDAAYLYLVSPLRRGESANTYLCDPQAVGGMINLDFDQDGMLLGIEILGAAKKLRPEVLSAAEIIG